MVLASLPVRTLKGRSLLTTSDLGAGEIATILNLALHFKGSRGAGQLPILRGKTLAMLFEKPSLRTRVSFEVAMVQLGGSSVFAQGSDFMSGARETPEDAAEVLSRYADAVVVRTHAHEPLERFARASRVPVINGLSAQAHPCQALADLLTIREAFGTLSGLRIAYVGDARNNVAASLAEAAVLCGASINFGSPPSHRPSESFLAELQRMGRPHSATARAFTSPLRAVRDVDVVYTDTWTSMGEEALTERNAAILSPYCITSRLMQAAAPHAIFMHCLPAHRGQEVEAAVIDGRQSVVFDQAENRLHAQKALLVALLTDLRGMPV
ncbi:MAG TPA: ornithine carbamoyltransferase [Candidatus Baltobacteraceae bacterium]|jgi:ornithine carbamoyltransferase|nr:ornithine carbamoyltransferase [Candidatus Baltobacteraceae bacterium]